MGVAADTVVNAARQSVSVKETPAGMVAKARNLSPRDHCPLYCFIVPAERKWVWITCDTLC